MVGNFSHLYCINPRCLEPDVPLERTTTICPYCHSNILINNRYRAIKILGKGGFGKTYEVIDIKNRYQTNNPSRKSSQNSAQ